MAAFEDLKGKLREIFQLDRNDLDFGLYRIMNLKSEEVSKFIEEDLLPQVKNGLKEYSNFDYAEIQSELEKTIDSRIEPIQKEIEELRKYIMETKDIEKSHMQLIISSYKFRLV